jgi:hypothetical protein
LANFFIRGPLEQSHGIKSSLKVQEFAEKRQSLATTAFTLKTRMTGHVREDSEELAVLLGAYCCGGGNELSAPYIPVPDRAMGKTPFGTV